MNAYHLETVRQREEISDEELITQEPGIPGAAHPMEMNRRLKAAVIELTGEVIASRKSADRLSGRAALGQLSDGRHDGRAGGPHYRSGGQELMEAFVNSAQAKVGHSAG